MADKRVAITGAGSGIGYALALFHAKAGDVLFLAGRNPEKLELIKSACQAEGVDVFLCELDVRSKDQVKSWLEEIAATGSIDIVYANAGITNGVENGEKLERLDDLEVLLQTNLAGAIYTLSAAAEIMIAQGHGHLVAVSSLAAYAGFSGSPAYCASKAGLKIYCESLQRLLKSENVDLTVVYPGYVTSPMSERVTTAKPMTISAGKAAELIAGAAAQKKTQYGFPWLLWTGVRILSVLPLSVQNVFVPMFDYRVAPKD